MNFAFLYFLGFLSYNPGTFVRFMKSALKYFAISEAVESDVCLTLYSSAPQKTTSCFFEYYS